jgi:hypothetical protein
VHAQAPNHPTPNPNPAASYNVPFWREIYDKSGYKEQIAKRRPNGEPLGELSGLDWQLAPRAKIFRRDAGKVTDMDGFLQIMRSK